MNFVANFIRFPAVQKFGNRLRFDKVTESSKVGTFLRHSVVGDKGESILSTHHISRDSSILSRSTERSESTVTMIFSRNSTVSSNDTSYHRQRIGAAGCKAHSRIDRKIENSSPQLRNRNPWKFQYELLHMWLLWDGDHYANFGASGAVGDSLQL